MSNEIKNSENIKSCIILCGGQSRRMGQDKGSMIIEDKPDSKRIDKYRLFIDSADYTYKITFLEDKIKNKGPLPGIMTGLENISSQYALILPCDSPYVTKSYIETIFNEINEDYQAIVPYHDNDNKLKTSEPLHSIYNKNIIPEIEYLISKDSLHIKGLIKKIETKFVLIDNKKILKKEFRNLNRPADI